MKPSDKGTPRKLTRSRGNWSSTGKSMGDQFLCYHHLMYPLHLSSMPLQRLIERRVETASLWRSSQNCVLCKIFQFSPLRCILVTTSIIFTLKLNEDPVLCERTTTFDTMQYYRDSMVQCDFMHEVWGVHVASRGWVELYLLRLTGCSPDYAYRPNS